MSLGSFSPDHARQLEPDGVVGRGQWQGFVSPFGEDDIVVDARVVCDEVAQRVVRELLQWLWHDAWSVGRAVEYENDSTVEEIESRCWCHDVVLVVAHNCVQDKFWICNRASGFPTTMKQGIRLSHTGIIRYRISCATGCHGATIYHDAQNGY
jgi:hypothetical protein